MEHFAFDHPGFPTRRPDAGPQVSAPPRTPALHGERPVLPREIAEFLLELAGALQRFAMYPAGHPLLEPALVAVVRRLELVFLERAALPLAVTPTQLLVGGVASDPRHAPMRDLAERFYRRDVGAVKLLRGAGRAEALELLELLREREDGTSARRGTAPSDGQPAGLRRPHAPHLLLFPLSYDHLALLDETSAEPAPADEAFGAAWASRLWIGLARATLGTEVRDDANAVSVEPERLASSLDARLAGDGREDGARHIAASLGEAVQGMSGRGRAEMGPIQRHLARLLRSLAPETLERLVALQDEMGESGRRRFLTDAAQALAAESVLAVVEAAAKARGAALSPALLALLQKLAVHAGEEGDGEQPVRARADEALRLQVLTLLERWETPLAAPLDPDGRHLFERLAAPPEGPLPADLVRVYRAEPERLVRMAIELGVIEASVLRAADWMVAEGRAAALLDLLDAVADRRTGDPVAHALRQRVVSPYTVRLALTREPADLDLLDRLVPAAGVDAIAPLLDALALASERRTRARLLELLARYGENVGQEAAMRIADAPWYVQRNLLKLLSMLPALPRDFSPTAAVAHADPRVRHEGFRLLLRDPMTRASAIVEALEAPDAATLRLGLVAAAEHCPPQAIALIVRLLRTDRLDRELAPLAVRALADHATPAVRDALIDLCLERRMPLLGRRLRARSPSLLAALASLAAHWRHDDRAAPVLALALKQRDPAVRDAATPRPETPKTAATGPVILMP